MRSRILTCLLAALLLLLAAGRLHAEKGALPSLPETTITVPWDGFVRMLQELSPGPVEPPPEPPTDIAVGRAAYTMHLSSGRLEAALILSVTTYGKGWHELFVAGRDTPLISVETDGGDTVTLARGDGVWVAWPGRGNRTVRAVIACDAPDTPGPHTITISGPAAAVRSVDLSYPRGYADVGVGGVVTGSVPGRISSVLSGTGAITVSYTVAADVKPEPSDKKASGPPEIVAEVLTVMDIEEEALLAWTRVAYEVRNAPVRSFTIGLPQDFDLLDVTGEGVVSWRVSEDNSAVTVNVGYDVIGAYGLALSLERGKTGDIGSAALPRVSPVGAARTTGYVMVVSGGGYEVTEAASELLTPRDPSELPDAILSISALPPILAYRFTDPGYSLVAAVAKGEALSALSAFVDSANSVVLVTADGKAVVRTNYFIRNRSLQYLRITLPAGSTFWSATVRGARAKSSVDKNGVVMIPLPMGSTEAAEPFVVSVVIFVPTKKMGAAGSLVLPLPRLEIPTGEMMATLYLPEGMSYLSFGGDMERIEYFSEVLSTDASESFVTENLRLRKSVYKRQEDLEDAINRQEQTLEKEGTGGLPPAPEGFDMPLRGKVYRFVKLVVMGEETRVAARYVDTRLLIAVIVLFVIAAAAAAVRYGRPVIGRVKGRIRRARKAAGRGRGEA
jgi:hypothetical protein